MFSDAGAHCREAKFGLPVRKEGRASARRWLAANCDVVSDDDDGDNL